MRRYLLLLIFLPLIAGVAAWGGCQRAHSDRALRIYSFPPRIQAVIVDKASSTGSSKRFLRESSHTVTLNVEGNVLKRRVNAADWSDVKVGDATGWHVDPATGEGLSEVERTYQITGMYIPYALAAFLILSLCRAAWTGLPGGAGEARVRRGGPPGPEPGTPRLKPTPRQPDSYWEGWMSKKYPPLHFLALPHVAGAAVFAVPFLLLGWRESAVIMGIQAAMSAVTILIAGRRGRRRDRRLWRDGQEVRGTAEDLKLRGNVWFFEGFFTFGGESWRFRQRLPIECGGRPQGKQEVDLLVDPKNPRLATILPRR